MRRGRGTGSPSPDSAPPPGNMLTAIGETNPLPRLRKTTLAGLPAIASASASAKAAQASTVEGAA